MPRNTVRIVSFVFWSTSASDTCKDWDDDDSFDESLVGFADFRGGGFFPDEGLLETGVAEFVTRSFEGASTNCSSVARLEEAAEGDGAEVEDFFDGDIRRQNSTGNDFDDGSNGTSGASSINPVHRDAAGESSRVSSASSSYANSSALVSPPFLSADASIIDAFAERPLE